MVDTLYIERELLEHPRTQALRARLPKARVIECSHYGEIFNRKSQNFRLQKNNPALILAHKQNKRVLPAPAGYGIGGRNNYYFSHMLNCVYDCRYCFLQGMYRSANYLLFLNYEDFAAEIDRVSAQHPNEVCWFFSGYDCDSLAFEPVSGFVEFFLPFFAQRPAACLEIRSKSTQVRELLKQAPVENVVIAFSFTPEPFSRTLEHGVPALEKRLHAIQQLQSHGWRIGLRFDPLIYDRDYQILYKDLFNSVLTRIDKEKLHSVSLGTFRLPKPFYENMLRLYPQEALFAGPLDNQDGMVKYGAALEQEMMEFCLQQLSKQVPQHLIFPCT